MPPVNDFEETESTVRSVYEQLAPVLNELSKDGIGSIELQFRCYDRAKQRLVFYKLTPHGPSESDKAAGFEPVQSFADTQIPVHCVVSRRYEPIETGFKQF